MIRLLISAFLLATLVSVSAFVGSLFPEFLYTVVQPCAVSKWFGHTTQERNLSLIESLKWRIVDGDTIKCERMRIRLTGYDAPERNKNRAKCDEEVEVGKKATTEFEKALMDQSADHTTWRLTATGKKDSFDRPLAELLIGELTIKDILIEKGLAKAWINPDKEPKPDWCHATSSQPNSP